MASWFIRSGGNALNSGGGDADGPNINGDAGTPFVIAGGTGLTYAPGGLSALPADSATYTRSVNLQIAGVSTLRKITVLTDTTATLSASVANASYNGRIGGARATVQQIVNNGAGNNAAGASGDNFYCGTGQSIVGIFTMNILTTRLYVRGATLDGTGGGAGSDICTFATNGLYIIGPGTLANAVDRGVTGAFTPALPLRLVIQSPGGIGVDAQSGGDAVYRWISVRSPVGVGISNAASNGIRFMSCEVVDGTTHGYEGRMISMEFCLFADNGGDGCRNTAGSTYSWNHNTCEGNTGDGLEITTTAMGVLTVYYNNVLSNNGGYGINSSAGVQTTLPEPDYNLYFNNTTAARNNFDAGANDISADPLWISAASDDYTPGPLSPLLNAGYNPWKNSAAPTIGAVQADAIESADFPDEGDVRDGVVYGDGTLEGTLAVGGGGGAGIFPSQRRGGPGSRT